MFTRGFDCSGPLAKDRTSQLMPHGFSATRTRGPAPCWAGRERHNSDMELTKSDEAYHLWQGDPAACPVHGQPSDAETRWQFGRYGRAPHGGTPIETWEFYFEGRKMAEHVLPAALADTIRSQPKGQLP